METRIADVIVPETLSDMVSAQISKYIDFMALGIATKDYGNNDIKEGGHFANVPFYDQLTGDDEVVTDDTSLTPGKISTGKDIGVVCHRGKAWASRDLTKILSGDDPQAEIAKQVAAFWGKKAGQHLISVLNGVFGAAGALAVSHQKDVAVDDTNPVVTISATTVIQGCAKLGDSMDEFDVIVVHSRVYADMLINNLVTFPERFGPDNVRVNGDKGQFLGLDIIVTDDVPTSVPGGGATYTHYTTYLMKKGCMYYGIQKELMTESDRDILAQKDVLATTIHFVPHLKLVKWGVTTQNPSNAVLATPGNWTKVAEDDAFIGCVALVTNAAAI